MIAHYGEKTTSDTVYVYFNTFDSNDPSASVTLTGLALADIKIYKNGSVTQRNSTAGITLLDTDGIDFDGITGVHGFSIDLSDNTDAGFYATNSHFLVVVDAVTVDAATIRFAAAQFEISKTGGFATVIADTEALLVDTETIPTVITDTEAILVDTEAVIVDTEAAITERATILTDTEAGITERATLLTDTEAILVDTEALGVGSGLTPLATGTAQSGTASTIVLAASAAFADDVLNGNVIKIHTGTGAGQARVITSNTLTDDTCNVTPNWTTNPSSDSQYEIVEGSVNLVAVADTAQTAGDIVADTEAIGITANQTLTDTEVCRSQNTNITTDTEAILVDTEGLGVGSGLTPLGTGTAQSGTASTIVLAAVDAFADDVLNGNVIKIHTGTGAGQSRVITSNTLTDDTCNVTPNWTVNPSSDSEYEIVDGSVNITAVSNVAEDVGTETTSAAILVDTEALDTATILTDTEAVLTDTEAAITERSTLLTDTEAVLVDTEAVPATISTILVDTEAAIAERATILTDTEAAITERAAILTDTEAVLTDTETGITERATLLVDTEAINTATAATLVDTETGITERATLLTDTESILVDTESLGVGFGLTPLASGTAQSGTASTIVLAVSAAFADDVLNGNVIKIHTGTGAGQSRVITSNTLTDDTCNVTPNWTVNPSSDSQYEIVDGSVNITAVANAAEDVATETTSNSISGFIDTEITDIQSRLPAALVGGRIDSNTGSMDTNVLDADALAPAAITAGNIAANTITLSKIQNGAFTGDKFATDAIDKIRDGLLPTQNEVFAFDFLMVDDTDHVTPEPGLTLGVTRSIDGAAFGAGTGSVTESGDGIYEYSASAADQNGAKITYRFTSAGADDKFVTVLTGGAV